MKVLWLNRDHRLWVGGDAVQVDNTIKELEKLGVDCELTWFPMKDFTDYDLVHVMHLNFLQSKTMCRRLIDQNKPYIISAVFYPKVIDATFEEMREMVDRSVATIALSEPERKEIIELTGCNPDKVVVIPNGVDKSIFKMLDDDGSKPLLKRVVSVGRMVQDKGMDLVASACYRLGLRFTHVGEVYDNEYCREVLDICSEHFGNLRQAQLAFLHNTSTVYVCSSLSERQSLGVLEAAACGLRIVDSIHNRGNALLPNSIIVDPKDNHALDEAIMKQWNATGPNPDMSAVPSWGDVAVKIKDIYDKVKLP